MTTKPKYKKCPNCLRDGLGFPIEYCSKCGGTGRIKVKPTKQKEIEKIKIPSEIGTGINERFLNLENFVYINLTGKIDELVQAANKLNNREN